MKRLEMNVFDTVLSEKVAKISELSASKIDKYEHCKGNEQILPSDQSQMMQQTNRKVKQQSKVSVAKEDKNNIAYKIDCSNCEAVYFHELKQSLKCWSDENKRFFRNCNCERNWKRKQFGSRS